MSRSQELLYSNAERSLMVNAMQQAMYPSLIQEDRYPERTTLRLKHVPLPTRQDEPHGPSSDHQLGPKLQRQ